MDWRRAVVASDFFAPALATCRILAVHNAVLAPLDAGVGSVHLAAARVAGFDQAVYGLPSDAAPLLAERGNALVAESKSGKAGQLTVKDARKKAVTDLTKAVSAAMESLWNVLNGEESQ